MIDPYGENLSNFFGGKSVKKIENCGRDQGNFRKLLLDEHRRESLLNLELHKEGKERNSPVAAASDGLPPEIIEQKRKRFVEEARRQQIREQNHELKELEVKLRAAYVLKSLSAQIAEKEAQKIKEKEQRGKENIILEQARFADQERERIDAENEIQKKNEFRRELRGQLALVEAEKTKRYEEFLQEKQVLDGIARKLQEEHLEEMREKKAKRDRFIAGLHDFVQMQNDWKEMQRKQLEEEAKANTDLRAEKDREEQEWKDQKRRELERKQKISNDIGVKIQNIHNEKLKRTQVLEDLYIEEKKLRDEEKYREELEKELRQREEVKRQLTIMKEEIMKRRQQEQEEDLRYREEQMRLLAERDKLDQLSDEKRRRKMMEHNRVVQECLEEKKRRRAQDIAIMLKERDLAIQEEQRRIELVEEERIRILREHASNLLGYFPPGVLRESDRQFLPLPPKEK